MVKSNVVHKKRVPAIIWILLSLVALFSTVNLLQDTNSWGGFRPFGEFAEVFAQFVRTAPNTGRLVTQLATTEGFEDQSDRCEIIDPNRPTIETAGELNASGKLQLLGENMAGVNPGFDFTGGYDYARHQKILEYARSLGMSYTIGIFTDRSGAPAAIQFVNDSIEQGFIPIVRLCYINGCNFKDAESVIGFYKEISLGVEVPYIAMIGPNEPGTGSPTEMSGFFDDTFNTIADSQTSYANLVLRINTIADALQDLRVINGGDIYLSPGAFNLNNQEGRDTYELLYSTEHEVLDPNDYDYLMGNVYSLGADRVSTQSGSNIPATYAWYRDGDMLDGQGLGNYADEHGLQVILTEFGIIRNDNWPHGRNEQYLIQEAIDSFNQFCKDDTVQGVLFFRDFLDNAGNKIDDVVEDELGITQAQHAQIIGDCLKASPYKDWAWTNCNFDSCQYTHEYDSRSVASTCSTEDAKIVGDGRPALKASCSRGICQTKAIGTIDVAMPIKQFGGNTISGTPQFPYATTCAEVAQYTYGEYDALNQFAGVLTTRGGTQSGVVNNGGSINYNLSSDKQAGAIMVVGDSLSADTRYVPSSLFSYVNKDAAIGGSNARQFAGDPTGEYPINRSGELASAIKNAASAGVTTVFITLGTNQCGEGANAAGSFQAHMRSIIGSIKSGIPSANIYVVTIPYFDEQISITNYGFACDKATVDLYNSQLSSLGVSVLDFHTTFSVPTSGHTTDGIHLTDSAYISWNAGIYRIVTGTALDTSSVNLSPAANSGVSYNSTYSMPWLGSAINCSSQLILYSTDYSRFDYSQLNANPHVGSSMLESFYERTQGTIESTNWETFLGISGKAIEDVNPDLNSSAIQDEKAICVTFENGNEYCFDKVGDASEISNIQQYDPFKGISLWDTAQCSQEIIYRVNEANFITGPEIVVDPQKVVNTMYSSQLCYEFAKRKNGEESNIIAGYDYPYLVESPTPDKLRAITPSCEVNNKKVIDYVENGVNKKKYCAYAGICTSEDALKGDCKIDPFYADCFEYLNEYDNANHEIYYKASQDIYPSIPQYDIPGIYDSLYRLYQRVQANLKDKGMKIIFRENVGLQTRVNAKVRDASRSLSDSLNRSFPAREFRNLYAQETQNCSLQSNAYDYSNLLAKNAPIKTQYQYYEWLGYLDILQEIAVAYINDKDLPDAEIIDNPFYGQKLTQEQIALTPYYGKEEFPTSERATFLQPGISHKALSFPLYTCDEIEIRRVFDDTFSLFGTNEGKLTCLTTLDDERYPDELGEFLCNKGYEVEGLCGNALCPVPSTDDAVITPITDGSVSCPLRSEHRCFQGPKGDYSHCLAGEETNYPIDLFPEFPSGRNADSDNKLPTSEQIKLRDIEVSAPESGYIVHYKANGLGIDFGYTMVIKGDTGIYYSITHLEPNSYAGAVTPGSTRVEVGDKIGDVCYSCLYDYKNWHIHISATYNGKAVDPYTLYGEILGCNAKRPPKDAQNREKLGVGNGYCVYKTGELNDNLSTCQKDIALADNNVINDIFSSLTPTIKQSEGEESDMQIGANQPTTGSICQYSSCTNLEKNGISYPECPQIDYIVCDDAGKMNQLFGNGDSSLPFNTSLSCQDRANAIGAGVPLETISFLGFDFAFNSNLVEELHNVEVAIENSALKIREVDGDRVYVFPSGEYIFTFSGAFNARPIRGYEGDENCAISNHSWGTAIDLNAGTNGMQSGTCSYDIPPEVVQAFERYGFRWGGRFTRFDPMHFEYCVEKETDLGDNNPSSNVPNYCSVPTQSFGTLREQVLSLCSPDITTWDGAELTVDDVYTAFQKITSFEPNQQRTARIIQILDAAQAENINPAFILSLWFTEGGYLGDGVAGKTSNYQGAYGFDFGCGVYCSAGFANRLPDRSPTQAELDLGFESSLQCTTKTYPGSCNLACSYDNINSSQQLTIPSYGVQQPGLGGFLECYGPVVDNNTYFAKNFIKIYDAFFPVEGSNPARRQKNVINNCIFQISEN